ncbi:amidohydrolase, partial [gut metagenome]
MRYEEIPQLAERMNDFLIDVRRSFHRHPETSGQEQWTSAFLQNEAKKLGLPIEMVSKTGFIATLDTHRPGPHIALRADIDALPVMESEENLKGKRNCISEIPGCSHVCGHDAHMA